MSLNFKFNLSLLMLIVFGLFIYILLAFAPQKWHRLRGFTTRSESKLQPNLLRPQGANKTDVARIGTASPSPLVFSPVWWECIARFGYTDTPAGNCSKFRCKKQIWGIRLEKIVIQKTCLSCCAYWSYYTSVPFSPPVSVVWECNSVSMFLT